MGIIHPEFGPRRVCGIEIVLFFDLGDDLLDVIPAKTVRVVPGALHLGVEPVQMQDIGQLAVIAYTALLGDTIHEIAVADVCEDTTNALVPLLKTTRRHTVARQGPPRCDPCLHQGKNSGHQLTPVLFDICVELRVLESASRLRKVRLDHQIDIHEASGQIPRHCYVVARKNHLHHVRHTHRARFTKHTAGVRLFGNSCG